MTDPTDPSHEGDASQPRADGGVDAPLTPAQDAAVRRALADAGGAEPMPSEIADRLDAVLVSLAAERVVTPEISHPEDHRVLPLDPGARRRRVRARILLAAAAVVLVGAVGAGVVNGRESAGDFSAGEVADEPARSSADQAETLKSGSTDDGKTEQEAAPSRDADLLVVTRRVVTDEPLREVRSDHLREDLVALQQITLPHRATADYVGATLTAPEEFMCQPAAFGAGYLVGIEYDGGPAIAAFREPVGQTQEAAVLACGTGDVLHSTTLPATG